MPFVYVSVNAG